MTIDPPLSATTGPHSLEALGARLKDPDPAQRLAALEALGELRGFPVARLVNSAVADRDATVRAVALKKRARVESRTRLFGGHDVPRLELPPPMRSAEEERRATRTVWIMFIIGGFVSVNMLLVREHTGFVIAPIIGAFVVTLAVVLVAMRVMKPNNPPGWMQIEADRQQVTVELPAKEGYTSAVHPFRDLRALKRVTRTVARGEDETPRTTFELHLELAGGSTVILARDDEPQRLDTIAQLLRELVPVPAGG